MNNVLLIPLDPVGKNGQQPYKIWEKEVGDHDTFRVPNREIALNTHVAFWCSGVGIMGFGFISSSPFRKEDPADRNHEKLVAEITFDEILDMPITSASLRSAVGPVPVWIDSALISKAS